MKSVLHVICPDRMVFPVDAETLEPLRTSCYDAHAFTDPPQPSISHGEWCVRRNAQRDADMKSVRQER